jgi:hypothetical protein
MLSTTTVVTGPRAATIDTVCQVQNVGCAVRSFERLPTGRKPAGTGGTQLGEIQCPEEPYVNSTCTVL